MIFNIVDNLDVFVTQAPASHLAAINKYFTVSLIDCGKRYFGHTNQSPVVNFFDFNKGRINLQLLPDLIKFCDKSAYPYQIVDSRPEWPHQSLTADQIGPDFLAGISLETYQLRCIHSACDSDFGIIDAVTGAGKTEMMAAICKMNPGCNTVILSEQRVVIEQISERLQLRDVKDVGLFYSGKSPDGQSIVIASVQSSTKINKTNVEKPVQSAYKTVDAYVKALAKHESMITGFKNRNIRAEELRDIIKEADMLLVDECDLAVSPMYRSILRIFFKGRKRYGFTGSVFDKDKKLQSMKMRAYLGPIIAKASREEVLAAGRINDIKYTMFVFTGAPEEVHDSSMLNIAIDEKLTANVKYHKLLKGLCDFHADEKTLILVESKKLGAVLESYIPNSVFICGDTRPKARNAAVERFRTGETKILIGGKILKRGFDLKGGFDNVILSTGGKLSSDLRQRLGRGYRRSLRGYTRIYDFMYRVNKYLYSHSRDRLKTVVKIGVKTVVIYPNGFKIDGTDLVKRNFNVGKNWRQTS